MSSRWAKYLVRLVLTAVILTGLVAIANDGTLGDVLARLGFAAFLVATTLHVAGSIVIPAVVSHRSIRGTPMTMGLAQLVRINLSIRFYTMVLPRASATGVRWIKYRADSDGPQAAALVVLEKLVQVFVYSMLAGLFVVIEAPRLGRPALALAATCGGAAALTGLALAAVFTTAFDPLMSRWTLTDRFPALDRRLRLVASAVTVHRGRPARDLMALGAWSAVGFVFFVLSAWVVVTELDVALPLAGLVWIRGLVFLGTLIPVTIAGAGVREAGFVGFASLYDVAATPALGLALALLGLQIAIGAAGALVEVHSQFAGWRADSSTPPLGGRHADV